MGWAPARPRHLRGLCRPGGVRRVGAAFLEAGVPARRTGRAPPRFFGEVRLDEQGQLDRATGERSAHLRERSRTPWPRGVECTQKQDRSHIASRRFHCIRRRRRRPRDVWPSPTAARAGLRSVEPRGERLRDRSGSPSAGGPGPRPSSRTWWCSTSASPTTTSTTSCALLSTTGEQPSPTSSSTMGLCNSVTRT